MARRWLYAGLLCGFVLGACSSDGDDDGTGGSTRVDGGNADASAASDAASADGSSGAGGGTGGDAGTGGGGGGDAALCGALMATLRDFKDSHPDFEKYSGSGATTGIVEDQLGSDHTPVYANPAYANGNRQTTDAASFADWYHDVSAVNEPFAIEIALVEKTPGQFVFDSNDHVPPGFFPLDGMGFGNQGRSHNYHFTTEIHTSFTYRGGEVFRFRGDDDLWLFVNGKLALDLGGLHAPVEGTIDFDASAAKLGITPGETYSMDIFHAERHTVESNFRIETSIDCFIPVTLR